MSVKKESIDTRGVTTGTSNEVEKARCCRKRQHLYSL